MGVRARGLLVLFPVGRLMSTVTLSRKQFAVSVACFVGLVWLRTDDITKSFWLFGDQILFWNTALLPLHEQPLAGPEQHVGGYALGPGYNWFVWLSRVTFGPFYENLPHAGAIFQVLVHSAVDAFLLWALWRKTGSPWLASVTGLSAGLIIAFATEYYTSYEHAPTQRIAHQYTAVTCAFSLSLSLSHMQAVKC